MAQLSDDVRQRAKQRGFQEFGAYDKNMWASPGALDLGKPGIYNHILASHDGHKARMSGLDKEIQDLKNATQMTSKMPHEMDTARARLGEAGARKSMEDAEFRAGVASRILGHSQVTSSAEWDKCVELRDRLAVTHDGLYPGRNSLTREMQAAEDLLVFREQLNARGLGASKDVAAINNMISSASSMQEHEFVVDKSSISEPFLRSREAEMALSLAQASYHNADFRLVNAERQERVISDRLTKNIINGRSFDDDQVQGSWMIAQTQIDEAREAIVATVERGDNFKAAGFKFARAQANLDVLKGKAFPDLELVGKERFEAAKRFAAASNPSDVMQEQNAYYQAIKPEILDAVQEGVTRRNQDRETTSKLVAENSSGAHFGRAAEGRGSELAERARARPQEREKGQDQAHQQDRSEDRSSGISR